MKKVIIKLLKIKNFKGIEHLEINFSDNTDISGDNATGKTTIFDSITWLFFGKDSQDRKDFDIKNTVKLQLNRLPHEVEAEIAVNGKKITLKRVLLEKWVKPRGQAEEVFSGHETEFYVNLVPKQQKEYNEYIGGIINEELFKLITSPSYFTSLHWEKQRGILISIAGEVSDDEIAGTNKDFISLISELSGKSFVDYKKQITAQKSLIKDSIKSIPARIEECEMQKPETKDYIKVTEELEQVELSIQSIQNELSDIRKQSDNENNHVIELQREINKLKLDKLNLESNIKQQAQSVFSERETKVMDIDWKISAVNVKITKNKEAIKATEYDISRYETSINDLRAKYLAKQSEELVIDESALNCPTCKQPFQDVYFKKESMVENFNLYKVQELQTINEQGRAIKAKIEQLQTKLLEYKTAIDSLEKDKTILEKEKETINSQPIESINIQEAIVNNPNIKAIDVKIELLNESLNTRPALADTSSQLAQIKELNTKADELKNVLNEQNIILSLEKRIAELDKQLKSQNQELAQLEKKEFVMTAFEKAKMDYVESKVNAMFSMVKFKMFEIQINGGEKAICEAQVNGVPFSVVNNASRINAGIDIINTLCNYHQVSAPIIIDNKEAVNILLPTLSQTITLTVTKDKSLIIK